MRIDSSPILEVKSIGLSNNNIIVKNIDMVGGSQGEQMQSPREWGERQIEKYENVQTIPVIQGDFSFSNIQGIETVRRLRKKEKSAIEI